MPQPNVFYGLITPGTLRCQNGNAPFAGRSMHGILLFVPVVDNTGKQLPQHRTQKPIRTMEPTSTDPTAKEKAKAKARPKPTVAMRDRQGDQLPKEKLHQPAKHARSFMHRQPRVANQCQQPTLLQPRMSPRQKKNPLHRNPADTAATFLPDP